MVEMEMEVEVEVEVEVPVASNTDSLHYDKEEILPLPEEACLTCFFPPDPFDEVPSIF